MHRGRDVGGGIEGIIGVDGEGRRVPLRTMLFNVSLILGTSHSVSLFPEIIEMNEVSYECSTT